MEDGIATIGAGKVLGGPLSSCCAMEGGQERGERPLNYWYLMEERGKGPLNSRFRIEVV